MANIHASLRVLYPLVHPYQLPKSKLNPREFELSQQYMYARGGQASGAASERSVHSASLVGASGFSKMGYKQFRYVKRDDDEESLDSSESSYGEDSESDDGF